MRERIVIPDEMIADLMTERSLGRGPWPLGRSAILNHTFYVEVYVNLLFRLVLRLLLLSSVIG
jgi:hypothetical protein